VVEELMESTMRLVGCVAGLVVRRREWRWSFEGAAGRREVWCCSWFTVGNGDGSCSTEEWSTGIRAGVARWWLWG